MYVLQRISYSLLAAFRYRHLPPPNRKGARPADHGVGACVRRTRGRAVPRQSSQNWGQRPPGRLKYDAPTGPGCTEGARGLRPACGWGLGLFFTARLPAASA